MSGVQVGTHVKVGAKKGVVRFIGETTFAAGEWYGIELSDPKGKNNGTVNGETYFTCAPNHGIFCKKAQVRKDRSYKPPPEENSADASSASSLVQDPTPKSASNEDRGGEAQVHGTRKADPSSSEDSYKPSLGDRALFKDIEGTVAFVGTTQFSNGVWCGLVLDTSNGKNNGTVQGVKYFECKEKHGLFVRPAHLTFVSSKSSIVESAVTPPSHQQSGKEALTVQVKAVATDDAKQADSYSSSTTTPTPRTPVRSRVSPGRAQSQSRLLREQRRALEANAHTISELRDELRRKEEEIVRLSESGIEDAEAQNKRKERGDLEEKIELIKSNHENIVADLRKDLEAAEKKAMDAESSCAALQARLSRLESQQDKTQESARKRTAAASKAERRCKELEEEVAELHDIVENLTLEKEEFQLEKELAEEKIVDIQLELEQTTAALEDAKIVRMSKAASTSSVTSDKTPTSQDAEHNIEDLVDQNDKLREALLRLRDSSAQERAEGERRILALEKDVHALHAVSEKVKTLQEEKSSLEETVEHLKDQVDNANAFETLVEDLTERNIELTDEAAELAASVAELEELRDLSEEVEAQHVEFTQQLQQEIREKEAALTSLAIRLKEADQRDATQQRDLDRFTDLSRSQAAELEETKRKIAQLEQMGKSHNSNSSLEIDHRLLQRTTAAAERHSLLKCRAAILEAKLERFASSCVRSLLPRESTRAEDQSIQCLKLLKSVSGKAIILREHVSYVLTAIRKSEESTEARAARAIQNIEQANASNATNKLSNVGHESNATSIVELSRDVLESYKRRDLQSLCKTYGLRAVGKNNELIDRIVTFAEEERARSSNKDEENEFNENGEEKEAPGDSNIKETKESLEKREEQESVPHPYRVLCARSGVLLSDAEYYSSVLEIIICNPWGIGDAQFAEATKRALPAQRRVDSSIDEILESMRASSEGTVRESLVQSLEASVGAMAITTDSTLRLAMSEDSKITKKSNGDVNLHVTRERSESGVPHQKERVAQLRKTIAMQDVIHGVARLSALCELMSAVLGQQHHAILLAVEDNDEAEISTQTSVIETLTNLSKSHGSLRRDVKRLCDRVMVNNVAADKVNTSLQSKSAADHAMSDLHALSEHITSCRSKLATSVAVLQAVVPGDINGMANALFSAPLSKEKSTSSSSVHIEHHNGNAATTGSGSSCVESHKGARQRLEFVLTNPVMAKIRDSPTESESFSKTNFFSTSFESHSCPAFDRQAQHLRTRVGGAVQLEEEQRALKATLSKRIQEVYMKQRELDTVAVRVEKLKRKLAEGAKALKAAHAETKAVREAMAKEQAHFEEALEEVHHDVDRLETENHRYRRQLKNGVAKGKNENDHATRERASSREISRAWRLAAKSVMSEKTDSLVGNSTVSRSDDRIVDEHDTKSLNKEGATSVHVLKATLNAVVAQNQELHSNLIARRIQKLNTLPVSLHSGTKHWFNDKEGNQQEMLTCAKEIQHLKSKIRLNRARCTLVDLAQSPKKVKGTHSQVVLEQGHHRAKLSELKTRVTKLRQANKIALGMIPTSFGRRNFQILPVATLKPVLGSVSVY